MYIPALYICFLFLLITKFDLFWMEIKYWRNPPPGGRPIKIRDLTRIILAIAEKGSTELNEIKTHGRG